MNLVMRKPIFDSCDQAKHVRLQRLVRLQGFLCFCGVFVFLHLHLKKNAFAFAGLAHFYFIGSTVTQW